MKRWRLVLVSALTVLLTVTILPHTGWLSARSSHPVTRSERARASESDDPLLSEAGWRWRSGQPTHWRACVLQH